MKTRKKILRALGALILIAGIVCATMFNLKENRIKEYSTYCMDSVRHELGEYLENIHMADAFGSEGAYVYMGGVSYEGTDYSFSCKVYNKENVELKLEPLYDVCEGDECDTPGTPQEIGEPEEFISYYDNGTIREAGSYINGMKQGTWTTYDEEGNVIKTEEYKDGKLVNGTEEESESLILVFSPTGNTKRIATFISEVNDANLTEIIPTEEYTDEDRNWRNEESRTFKEFKDPSIRPEIQNEINLDGYDTIYLGYPIWFGITPNIILTLLEKYNFAGKNIILFCTSEHVGIEKSVEYLQPYNLNVIGSKRFAQDATKEEVQEWLESL